MKRNQIIAILVVSLTLILCAFIFSNAIKHRNDAANVISVTGMAERNFESDLIVWKS